MTEDWTIRWSDADDISIVCACGHEMIVGDEPTTCECGRTYRVVPSRVVEVTPTPGGE